MFERFAPLVALVICCSVAQSQSFSSGTWAYTTDPSGEATITSYSGPGGAVDVPSSLDGKTVTRFGNGQSPSVFGALNTSVTSVTLPTSVTTIGDYAFSYCAGLTNVSVPSSVKSIGALSFAHSALTSATIPDSVTSVGDNAFQNCTALTNVAIGRGLTIIRNFVFAECTNLARVTIPDGVTRVGNWAFHNTGLTSLSIPNSVTSIGEGAFSYCLGLTSVVIPDSVTDMLITTFAGCTNLESVTVGNGVSSVIRAFSGCTALTSVVLGTNVSFIWETEFINCSSLKSILCRGSAPINWIWASNLLPESTIFYMAGAAGWSATYGGRPTHLFAPTASSSSYAPAAGFQFSWTNTGSIPMSVRRAASMNGPWTVVSSNNATGQFVDPNPPSGKAFYQAYLP